MDRSFQLSGITYSKPVKKFSNKSSFKYAHSIFEQVISSLLKRIPQRQNDDEESYNQVIACHPARPD